MNLYIVYGSESVLLNEFYKKISGKVIRIYNNKIPNFQKNFIDIKINDNIEFELKKIFEKIKTDVTKITFLGVGFAADSDLFFSLKEEEIKKLLEANIVNYIKLTKLILPFMMTLRGGKFIYLSSFRSQITTRGTAIYSSSKSFGETFFKTIGLEYGRFNITSHIIRMGYFDGRLLDNLSDEKKKEIKNKISLSRLGNAKDLASTINMIENLEYNNSGIVEITGGLDFS